MATLHFTKAAIEAIVPPVSGKVRIKDAKQHGLVLLVMASGARSFYYYAKHGGTLYERQLGRYPVMTVDQARQAAALLQSELSRGVDPKKATPTEPTLGEIWEWWWEGHAKPKASARRQISETGLWRLHLAPVFEHRRLQTITRSDLRAHHVELGNRVGHRTANYAMAMVRSMWNKALIYELTQLANPADRLEKFPEVKRDRRMMPAEAAAFFEAVAASRPTIRDFVLLLLFTGARRRNVQAMRWDEIDWQARTWRIPKTKGGKPQVIPLEDAELELLRARFDVSDGVSPYVFPSRTGAACPYMSEPKKGWAALCQRAGIKDFRMHDLRRTLASFMVDTGSSLAVVGSALGHTSPAATAIYARIQLDPVRLAKRRALEAITEAREGR